MTRPLDLRLLAPVGSAWVAAAVGLGFGVIIGGVVVLALLVVAAIAVVRRHGRPAAPVLTVSALTAAAAVGAAALHATAARPALLTTLAARHLDADVAAVAVSDGMLLSTRPTGTGRQRPLVRVLLELRRMDVAGQRITLRAPALLFSAVGAWADLRAGQSVLLRARLAPARDPDVGAVLLARGPPVRVGAAAPLQRAAARVRDRLRLAAATLPAPDAALLTGLVDGDTTGLPPTVREQFRATGLTHLVAVSGANLAIVIGTVLAIARRLRARKRVAALAAMPALLGFVAVAGAEPSVSRAAVMAVVILTADILGRPRAALPGLAAAVLLLVLVDPWLAREPGFLLSVSATAGLVLLGPPLARRLAQRLPPLLAEALAVPLAAQVACAPALAALFGRVSLVAVPANVLAAPFVVPATILGFLAALSAPLCLPAAEVLARLARPCTAALLALASWGAHVPGGSMPWLTGVAGAALLCTAIGALVIGGRRVVVRRSFAAGAAGVLLAGLAVRVTAPPWPPAGWALVACDVGQGDALVLRTGPGSAVVVDTGPDPDLIDRCLHDLGVRQLPLVVLSHLHADHVEGLPGVLAGRSVGLVETGPLDQPPAEWARVRGWATSRGVAVVRAIPNEVRTVGTLRLQLLAPAHAFRGTPSDPNNSSLVFRADAGGLRVLLTGDIELAAQAELLRSGAELHADVLKVPHHGSARQLPEFLDRVGERVTVTSVGTGNDYGHPAPTTLATLAADSAAGFRTDQDGSVALFRRGPDVVAVGRHGAGTGPTGHQVRAAGGAPPAAPGFALPAVATITSRIRRRSGPVRAGRAVPCCPHGRADGRHRGADTCPRRRRAARRAGSVPSRCGDPGVRRRGGGRGPPGGRPRSGRAPRAVVAVAVRRLSGRGPARCPRAG